MKKATLYGPDGMYVWGDIQDGGSVGLHDNNGGYYHGTLQEDGSITFHGPNNSYFFGRVDFERQCSHPWAQCAIPARAHQVNVATV